MVLLSLSTFTVNMGFVSFQYDVCSITSDLKGSQSTKSVPTGAMLARRLRPAPRHARFDYHGKYQHHVGRTRSQPVAVGADETPAWFFSVFCVLLGFSLPGLEFVGIRQRWECFY
ncbi:unnamed protein product [Ectocarpus sp. 12 AP-2014]